jgi:hypothetical protein
MFRSLQDHHQTFLWIKSVMLRTCWYPNCDWEWINSYFIFFILGWGYQPERVQDGIYLLFYTLLASLPLLVGILFIYRSIGSSCLFFLCWDPNMYAALLTWFIRRPDDGPVRTETCSLPLNKYNVPDVNCFIILIIKLLAHRDLFNQKKNELDHLEDLDMNGSINIKMNLKEIVWEGLD